ncbi:MAG: hypothetical protein ABIW82_18735 [Dokdonella sp.]
MEFSRRLILALAASLPALAQAGQADVCHSPTVPVQTMPPLSNTTQFSCPQAGSHTIPELAQAGWKIVQVTPMSDSQYNGNYELVIQK